MTKTYEITLAGFDGSTDETDDLVVWIQGDEQEIRALVEGTGATFQDEVSGVDPDDAEYTLPGDAEALKDRIAEQDRKLAKAPTPSI